ncbi:hypothetical protein AGOR_G00013430 [Albula goreensis]|uniref:MARVEL domain-containing protein n=1 Tax=Albula goreensis TaxID=1534307 RepID=A0A8T3EBK2_9TELE|nr:hypothetical protein AGOR_G00013430 [Albula goreensis]
MSSKPNVSPPPNADNGFHGSRELYDGDVPAHPAYSYYPDDEFLHFYRWTSPPGVIKIILVIIIVLCVAIFACVASTLAWDTQMRLSSIGGMANEAENVNGYGNNYNDPRKGKDFMIAMAAICFIAVMVIFILVVSRQSISRSRRFYLAVIIICTILAFLMLIATIVYLVAVNPMAQSYSSKIYSQIQGRCAQFQTTQPPGDLNELGLYHYCVVDPQEAIAIVFGFLVTLGLIIMLIFAVKTRQKIGSYGKENILWQRVKMVEEVQPNGVEE